MSDSESVEVGSEATEEECAQDASAASTSASTPQPAVQPKVPVTQDASKLQELLQLRAQKAIEGAKARGVERDNQRMANAYVHSVLRRVVEQLGWVEEERLNRERLRKRGGSSSGTMSDRPSRRRERKRELRRQLREYEEVPGGGQFLMMLLSKNRPEEVPGSKSDKDEGDPSHARDPAIVQVSMTHPESAAVAPIGKGKGEVCVATSKGKGEWVDVATSKGKGEWADVATSKGKGEWADYLRGKEVIAEGRDAGGGKGNGKAGGGKPTRPEPPPRSPVASYSSSPVAYSGNGALNGPGGKGAAVKSSRAAIRAEAAAERAQQASPKLQASRTGEQLNLQSLLRGPGATSEHGPYDQAPNPQRASQAAGAHVSRSSEHIFAKMQKLVSKQEDKAQPQGPVIPPMPGFSASIWGSPSSGPSTSPFGGPAKDPWAGDPWALPERASNGTDRPAPPGLEHQPDASSTWSTWTGPQAPASASSKPCASPALPSRGRRGGRIRDRRREEPAQDEDLWDMPVNSKALSEDAGSQLPDRLGDSQHPVGELPEFFRDSQAPSFVGHTLDRPAIEAELNGSLETMRYRGRSDAAAYTDRSLSDCLGSLRLEDDFDDVVIPKKRPIVQFQ